MVRFRRLYEFVVLDKGVKIAGWADGFSGEVYRFGGHACF